MRLLESKPTYPWDQAIQFFGNSIYFPDGLTKPREKVLWPVATQVLRLQQDLRQVYRDIS